jgi:hypothetical protein
MFEEIACDVESTARDQLREHLAAQGVEWDGEV